MNKCNIKDWLGLIFAGLTALFAGLVWWLARKSFEPTFELLIDKSSTFDCMRATLHIENKGRATVLIDQIRAYSPIGLRVSHLLTDHFDPSTGKIPLLPEWADSIDCSLSVSPGKSSPTVVLLKLPEDLRFSTRVSISVRIVRRSWIMPYKTKVITAILPESIKKAKD